VQELLRKRVALITGKGGVGRTSVTAALAHVAQRAGKRVLVAEVWDGTDGASPLAQLFGVPRLPRTVEPLAEGILGTQLRPDVGVELFLASVLRIARVAKAAIEFDPLRRMFLAVPSLRELGIFFHLLTYLRAKLEPHGEPAHQLILLDMPATGHTLALTGLPEIVLGLIRRGPIADALREGQSYLNVAETSAAYVVTLPEELPVSESLELLEGLQRTQVASGGLFVNRMPTTFFDSEEVAALNAFLPGRALFGADGFHRAQESHRSVERLRGSTPLPLLELPNLETSGPELVQELAERIQATLLRPAGEGAR